MFPIILVAKDASKIEAFLSDFIEKGKYSPFVTFKISPIKTEISIDQIRAIKKEIVTFSSQKRLFIVYSFDTASLEAQNAFLKTLEEKNESNQFILVVTDIGRILPTITSRSKVNRIDPQVLTENINESVERLLQTIEEGSYSFLTSTTSITKEDSIKLFDHIIVLLEKRLFEAKIPVTALLKKALQQKNLLVSNNLNPQLAVDSYLLYYKKTVSATGH